MPKYSAIDNLSKTLQIIKLMARENGATLTEISKKTGIDRWTVRGMIDSMEDFAQDDKGLCIEEYQDENDRRQTIYKVPKENLWTLTLPGMDLTDEEGILLALMFGQNDNSPILSQATGQLKKKLNMFKNIPQYEIMNVATAKKNTTELTQKVLVELLNAIQNDECVKIAYRPVQQEEKEYELRPLGVFRYDAGYYLAAQKLPGGEYRTFGVERIEKLPQIMEYPKNKYPERVAYEERFKDPFGPFSHGEEFEAVLKFNAFEGSLNMEKKWPKELVTIEKQKDESVIMRVKTHTVKGLTQWLLSFGSQVEVLEPQWLKDHMKEELNKTLELYF